MHLHAAFLPRFAIHFHICCPDHIYIFATKVALLPSSSTYLSEHNTYLKFVTCLTIGLVCIDPCLYWVRSRCRYGDPVNPVGDLQTMAQISCSLKPGGFLFLAVPVGRDLVFWNAHSNNVYMLVICICMNNSACVCFVSVLYCTYYTYNIHVLLFSLVVVCAVCPLDTLTLGHAAS